MASYNNHPHIYHKKKYIGLHIQNVSRGDPNYLFSGGKGIEGCINQLNNLNAIIGNIHVMSNYICNTLGIKTSFYKEIPEDNSNEKLLPLLCERTNVDLSQVEEKIISLEQKITDLEKKIIINDIEAINKILEIVNKIDEKVYMHDTEKVIIEHNISSLIMQMVVYDFEEYLEYEGLYINQRRIAKRYLRRSLQILKKNLPPGLTISNKYLSHLL